jgi:hypothetical protein
MGPEHKLILRLPDSREPNAGVLAHGQIVQATGGNATETVPRGVPITWIEITHADAFPRPMSSPARSGQG